MQENHYFLTKTGAGSKKETYWEVSIELRFVNFGLYLLDKLSSSIGRKNVGLVTGKFFPFSKLNNQIYKMIDQVLKSL